MKIAFYKGPGKLFDHVIRAWTRGPYSHAEVVFDDDLSGPVLCASSSALDGGVRFKRMFLSPDRWDIIDVPAFDTAAALQWFVDHDGLKYDYLGLFSVWTPVKHSRQRWYCTESIAAAANIKDPWRWDPNRFACLVLALPGSTVVPLA